MLTKFVLLANGLIFLLYGVACLFSPELAAGYIGYELTTADKTIEVIAMYGGLQTGFGLFCLFSAFSTAHSKSAVVAICLIMGGLALSRLLGIAIQSGDPTQYTYGAAAFESLTTLLALLALRETK